MREALVANRPPQGSRTPGAVQGPARAHLLVGDSGTNPEPPWGERQWHSPQGAGWEGASPTHPDSKRHLGATVHKPHEVPDANSERQRKHVRSHLKPSASFRSVETLMFRIRTHARPLQTLLTLLQEGMAVCLFVCLLSFCLGLLGFVWFGLFGRSVGWSAGWLRARGCKFSVCEAAASCSPGVAALAGPYRGEASSLSCYQLPASLFLELEPASHNQ